MKLKQTSPCKAMKLNRFLEIGRVIMNNGNQLVVLAEKKGWCKHYDSRSKKRTSYKLQRQHNES